MTRAESVQAAFATAVRAFGKVNVCVNCAGILTHAPIEDTTEQDWQRILEVNLTGAIRGCVNC